MVRPVNIFVLLLLLFTVPASGQWSMIVSAGISPQQTPGTPYVFANRSTPRNEFTFNLAQVKASAFLGAGAVYNFMPFFVSAEAQYNRREYVYDVAYTYPGFGRSAETISYSESMHMINLPVSVGVNLGIVEVTSGLLPQLVVSHESDMQAISGYTEELGALRMGWQSGVAARLSNLRIGFTWQMDFNNYGDHLAVNGNSLRLQGHGSRVVGHLGYIF